VTPRLRMTSLELIRALESVVFDVVRVRGSHHRLRHPDGRVTSVPVHSGETVGPGLLSKILRDCELERGDVEHLLGQ
jgi:predicted RNA binding protein YcfA (HicA-like mRNA interferase family)